MSRRAWRCSATPSSSSPVPSSICWSRSCAAGAGRGNETPCCAWSGARSGPATGTSSRSTWAICAASSATRHATGATSALCAAWATDSARGRPNVITQTPEQFRLNAVAGYIESRPDNDELRSLCELAALLCDAPIAAVNLLDHQFQHTVAAYGADSQICAKEDSMCATTIAADEDIYLEDARLDPRFEHHPWVDGRRGTV